MLSLFLSIIWAEAGQKKSTQSQSGGSKILSHQVCFSLLIKYPHFYDFLKRMAYTQTAFCYGSKYVTLPDATSKRYLWDKISCFVLDKSYTKISRTDISSRTLQAAVIVLLDIRNLNTCNFIVIDSIM